MNIKNKAKSIVMAILLLFVGSVSANSMQATNTPEQAVKNFYQWYTKELSREGGNPIKNK